MNLASQGVLQIEDLSITYARNDGALLALRNVNLIVPKDSVVGVVGESGCGKSTLISSMFRLNDETALVTNGRMLVTGVDVLRLSEREMNQLRGGAIAMIFQDPFNALNPVISVGRQLADVQRDNAASRVSKRRKALAALERVGIDEAETRLAQFPHELSGGMLQRICIAMAMLAKPALLVADEPTTALDATTEVAILDLLREFQTSTGASILIVSHQLSVIANLCQWIAIMYAGEIVEQGDVRSLFEHPLHPYTELLLECDPARSMAGSRRLLSIPGVVAPVRQQPRACVFAARCPKVEPRCQQEVPTTHAIEGRLVKCHRFAGVNVG